MKKFILFCFFVSCVLTQLYAKSQGTVEKMNYSPIKSGNYYNLISKGDTNINKLYQNLSINFMIYSTFLEIYPIDINNSKIEIGDVSSYDGVVMGRANTLDFNNGNFLGDISCLNCNVTIGNVISNGNLNFYTDIAEINNDSFGTLTLDGMRFPKCSVGWSWKTVTSASDRVYKVLACGSSGGGGYSILGPVNVVCSGSSSRTLCLDSPGPEELDCRDVYDEYESELEACAANPDECYPDIADFGDCKTYKCRESASISNCTTTDYESFCSSNPGGRCLVSSGECVQDSYDIHVGHCCGSVPIGGYIYSQSVPGIIKNLSYVQCD